MDLLQVGEEIQAEGAAGLKAPRGESMWEPKVRVLGPSNCREPRPGPHKEEGTGGPTKCGGCSAVEVQWGGVGGVSET